MSSTPLLVPTATSTPDDGGSSVFQCPGLLEYILSYSSITDLAAATEVNRWWKQAGRSDMIWKESCCRFWINRVGMKRSKSSSEDSEEDDDTVTLFWRSCLSDEAIQKLTASEIHSFFDHFLLSQEKKQIQNFVSLYELQAFFQNHRNRHIESTTYTAIPEYNDLWFGSFCSSAIDAKRHQITLRELCNPYGFDMYFKIPASDIPHGLHFLELDYMEPYEDNPDMVLYRHSVCYFTEEDHMFQIELESSKRGTSLLQHSLRWNWSGTNNTAVQVGPYPPLDVIRLPNWGWKLENINVVLMYRDSRRIYNEKKEEENDASDNPTL